MPDVYFSLKSMQSNASEKAHSSRKSQKFNCSDEETTVKPLAKKSRGLENDMEEISAKNSKIITKTIKTITEVGRPKSAANEYYPLGTIEFQQKLFMQLNDQKERLKNIEKSQKVILKFLSKDDKVDGIEEISKAESIGQLKDIRKLIKN